MADVVGVAEDTQQAISINTDFIIEDCMVQVSELEPELEALVLESIHVIRGKHKRPDRTEICKFICKNDSQISEQKIISTIDILLKKELISRRRPVQGESFSIAKPLDDIDNSVTVYQNVSAEDENKTNQDVLKLKAEMSALKNYIVEEVHSMKLAQVVFSESKNTDGDTHRSKIIKRLEDEVKFLRDELLSKNAIINIILEKIFESENSDRFSRRDQPSETVKTPSYHCENGETKWQQVNNKTSNRISDNYVCPKPLHLSNRFEDLRCESDDNCSVDEIFTNKSTENNNNYDENNQRHNLNIPNRKSTNRRSSVVINNHPENQHNFRNIPRDVAENHREEKKKK